MLLSANNTSAHGAMAIQVVVWCAVYHVDPERNIRAFKARSIQFNTGIQNIDSHALAKISIVDPRAVLIAFGKVTVGDAVCIPAAVVNTNKALDWITIMDWCV